MLNFNKLFSSLGILIGIWMVFLGETVVGFLDFSLGGRFGNTEDFVRIPLGLGKVFRTGVESLFGIEWGGWLAMVFKDGCSNSFRRDTQLVVRKRRRDYFVVM